MNRSPRMVTVLVAVVLIVIGALGTFGDMFSEKVGVWSYVAATAVMLLGVFLRKI